jgi:hypothetical protein
MAPNPTKEDVTITYTAVDKESLVVIYDLLGRSVGSYNLSDTANSITITTSEFPTGIYVVVLRAPSGILYQQKLIKE